jgi:hypothetical protein
MQGRANIRNGLIIGPPWLDLILDGTKDWEMRSRTTRIRGPIAIVRKGSRLIVGITEIVDIRGPLSRQELVETYVHHRLPPEGIRQGTYDRWSIAWVLRNTVKLNHPVPYQHKSGVVRWVKIDAEAQRNLENAI